MIAEKDVQQDEELGQLLTREIARKQAHTAAEKKRRDAIRRGYDDLGALVPTCVQAGKNQLSTTKLSKATILSKTIDYIELIKEEEAAQQEQLSKLQYEAQGQKIVLQNYETMIKNQRLNPSQQSISSNDQVKVNYFKSLCDELFKSFDAEVDCKSFATLSRGMLHWSERHCQKEHIAHLFNNIAFQSHIELTPQVGNGHDATIVRRNSGQQQYFP
ncbi:Oidioi.mRNA.OKI2018_I69.XSR.g16444.t1.cds [Oikopleura dioica]|uniref:Oidioi.mRNA.OKI2018_I69.XSR.g16444.t1.cds n=1 Tax=Oikopleura dioica TaxID=34765 RepID=A0ABN7SG39_OIKDI|nr:Oidioi.mRNA.OKI2018_I69.XSR.g16444.t1.cds [Oikopleura dioica]